MDRLKCAYIIYNRKIQEQLASSTSRSRSFTLRNKASCMATKCFQRPKQKSSHKQSKRCRKGIIWADASLSPKGSCCSPSSPSTTFPIRTASKAQKDPPNARKLIPLDSSDCHPYLSIHIHHHISSYIIIYPSMFCVYVSYWFLLYLLFILTLHLLKTLKIVYGVYGLRVHPWIILDCAWCVKSVWHGALLSRSAALWSDVFLLRCGKHNKEIRMIRRDRAHDDWPLQVTWCTCHRCLNKDQIQPR